MLKHNWASLFRPTLHPQEPDARQNSQLLSSLLLAILALQGVEFWLPHLLSRGQYHAFGNDGLFFVVLLAVTLISYYSCRRLNYKLAAWLVVAFLSAFIIITAYPDSHVSELNLFAYYLLPILISIFFLSIQAAFAVTLVGIASMMVISYLVPDSPANTILLAQGQFVLVISALLVLAMYHWYRLEVGRREKLAASEQQLRLITDNIQEGICLIDLDGAIRYMSPAFKKQTDLRMDSLSSIYDKAFVDRLHPDDFEGLQNAFQRAVVSKTAVQVEYRFQVKSGTYRWLESSIRFLNDAQPPGMILVCRDVHERKQAEDALAGERNLLRTLIDHLPDQIYAKDREARLVLSNAANTRRLGAASEQEVLGKSDFDRYPPELAERYYADDRDVIDHGKTIVEREEPSLTADSRPTVVVTTKAPLYDTHQHIIGLVASTRDITQRKQMEQQIREAENLHIALDKEKELTALKNQFMTTISHEFRTPLATILSSSELLERYAERLTLERKQECLTTIRTQVSQLTSLLQDMTMIISVERDQITFEPEQVNIGALCEEILSEWRAAAAPQRRFEFKTEGLLDDIGADKRLLHYILHNVLSNAVKYSPPETLVKLNVRREGSQMVFSIIDQGIGICAEDRARLFEPFFRGRNVGNINGTGLGLKIVKDCVDIYGGVIAFENGDGGGTRVTVRLPTAITK
jgi:PAS domain S-box-containing protein